MDPSRSLPVPLPWTISVPLAAYRAYDNTKKKAGASRGLHCRLARPSRGSLIPCVRIRPRLSCSDQGIPASSLGPKTIASRWTDFRGSGQTFELEFLAEKIDGSFPALSRFNLASKNLPWSLCTVWGYWKPLLARSVLRNWAVTTVHTAARPERAGRYELGILGLLPASYPSCLRG
jgi:hypothetical protein